MAFHELFNGKPKASAFAGGGTDAFGLPLNVFQRNLSSIAHTGKNHFLLDEIGWNSWCQTVLCGRSTSTGFFPELCSGIVTMPRSASKSPNTPSHLSAQRDLHSTSDSDVIFLDPTVLSQRTVPRTFCHYELIEPIGEGQFGTVWRATDQRLNRIVALKLPPRAEFDERRRSHFLREARAAAVLEHPNIVQVYGVDQEGDQPGIVSQFIEGQTLFDFLQERRPSFAESVRVLAIVADAVHHAHEAGVIHRDLKPSNILMDLDHQPHVSDFGLAKWIGDKSTLTNPGDVLGTPAYMSPEQARGDSGLVDRRSDVYSLGVLLYELMTGKPPFEGNSTLLLHQIQSQEPCAPRTHDKSIPLDLETICLKCLAKSPAERYSTARELAEDLQRFLANEPITARKIRLTERCLRWTRRNPTVTALVALSIMSTFTAIGLGASLLGNSAPSHGGASLGMPNSVHPINVTLNTEPEGATVVFYPLDPSTGEPVISKGIRPKEKSPVNEDLLPGDYLVVAALPDGRFHEVYRHVPREVGMEQRFYLHSMWKILSPNAISLYPIAIPASHDEPSMSLLATEQTRVEDSTARIVNPFFLDQREVRVGEVLPKFGNRLPPSLGHRSDLLQSLDLPITGLLFDEALDFAEHSGKRLPTAMEYEFAATNGWTTLFPWGDTEPPSAAWQLSAEDKSFDETPTSSPIYGLFSNASEFVFAGELRPEHGLTTRFLMLSPELSGLGIRGGPVSSAVDFEQLKSQGARWQFNCSRMFLSSHVGFRCAKSKSPRL